MHSALKWEMVMSRNSNINIKETISCLRFRTFETFSQFIVARVSLHEFTHKFNQSNRITVRNFCALIRQTGIKFNGWIGPNVQLTTQFLKPFAVDFPNEHVGLEDHAHLFIGRGKPLTVATPWNNLIEPD